MKILKFTYKAFSELKKLIVEKEVKIDYIYKSKETSLTIHELTRVIYKVSRPTFGNVTDLVNYYPISRDKLVNPSCQLMHSSACFLNFYPIKHSECKKMRGQEF